MPEGGGDVNTLGIDRVIISQRGRERERESMMCKLDRLRIRLEDTLHTFFPSNWISAVLNKLAWGLGKRKIVKTKIIKININHPKRQ